MKKKVFSIFLLLIILFSLTGCVKYNAEMNINEDKSMNFSIIYAMANSIFEIGEEASNRLLTADQKKDLIKQGFSVENYSDDNYKGFKISKKINNIDDVSLESDVVYSLSNMFDEPSNVKMFKVIKDKNKNVYTANFKFDANESDIMNNDESTESENNAVDGSTTEENIDLSGLDEALQTSLDLKYVVKLPYAAISSNATSKSEDGRELTWDLSSENVETIRFQFELNNQTGSIVSTSNGSLPMLFIIIALLVVIIVMVLLVKKGRNNQKNGGQLDIPVVPTELTSAKSQTETETTEVQQPIKLPDEKPIIEVTPINPINPYEQVENKENIITSTETSNNVLEENIKNESTNSVDNQINQFEIGSQNVSINDNQVQTVSPEIVQENIVNKDIIKNSDDETPLI